MTFFSQNFWLSLWKSVLESFLLCLVYRKFWTIMSDSPSPSVLSHLRQYRFQRKPNGPTGSSSPVTVTASPSYSRKYLHVMPAYDSLQTSTLHVFLSRRLKEKYVWRVASSPRRDGEVPISRFSFLSHNDWKSLVKKFI